MRSVAVGARRSTLADVGLGLPLAIGFAGTLFTWFGGSWDVSWHRVLGRDTFWSPPHLFLYAGVTLWGIAALFATLTAIAGRPVRGPEIRVGPLRAEAGLAVVGFGALGVILSAPFDEAWHRFFGRDVDIWSPPHLAAVAAIAVVYAGWAVALAPGVFPIGETLRRFLRVAYAGNLCAVLIFGTNFYYLWSVTREAFFYPLAVAVAVPAALALFAVLEGSLWAATLAAAWYTAFGIVTYGVLAGSGWRPPAFPPLIVAGALGVDLARRRGGRWASPLAIAGAFIVAFVAAELVRMVLVPPGMAPPSLFVDDDPGSALFRRYYAQALARPWVSLWPLAAIAAGVPVAAASWVAGTRVARAISAREVERQSVMHA